MILPSINSASDTQGASRIKNKKRKIVSFEYLKEEKNKKKKISLSLKLINMF